jgi:hypothetical protein
MLDSCPKVQPGSFANACRQHWTIFPRIVQNVPHAVVHRGCRRWKNGHVVEMVRLKISWGFFTVPRILRQNSMLLLRVESRAMQTH